MLLCMYLYGKVSIEIVLERDVSLIPDRFGGSSFKEIGIRPRGLGKPLFKYVGNMHGNEVVGRQYLLENYGRDERVTRLIDTTELWILPSLNPDGYETSTEGSCSRGPGRSNAKNVDLNRDFPKQFDEPINVGFEQLARGRAKET
ncbi:Carboxypeptidase Dlike, partial [Caligus rogercresseyi]